MTKSTRRGFLRQSAGLSAAALTAGPLGEALLHAAGKSGRPGSKMKLGLVTYQWGKDWDLPTVIANCAKSKVLGVELRSTHKHGVELKLNAQQRKEVKQRFADSPVTFVGPGSAEEYHDPDPAKLKKSIEATKAFCKLSHDCGGSGVKVRPNGLPKGVAKEKTIEQIGKALNECGKYAADYGQEIRVEVHGGGTSELPIVKAIMDVATHKSVGVCWNCNGQDLNGKGLEHNFNLVKDRFGATAHVRELNIGNYPYQQMMSLFVKMNYAGWILLECRKMPKDRVAAMIEQREIFQQMIAKGRAAL